MSPARTPEERALVGRIAVAERWSKTKDRTTATEHWRNGLRAKWAAEIVAELGELEPHELERHIECKQRAHMDRMTLAAAVARRRARQHAAISDAAERDLAELSGGAS